MRTSRHRPFFLVIVLSLLLLPTVVEAGPKGNDANAKLCQKGGWTQVQGTDGTRFANEQECVAYAAQGGTLQPIPTPTPIPPTPTPIPPRPTPTPIPPTPTLTPTPMPTGTVTVSFIAVPLANHCGVQVDVAGFAPGTYDVVIEQLGVGSLRSSITVEADGTGSMETVDRDEEGNIVGGSVFQQGSTVTATVNGVTSDSEVVAC